MRRRRTTAAAATSLSLAAAALIVPVWPAVSVAPETAGGGHVLPDPEGGFTVAFNHSVDGLPVQDVYGVEDGQLMLRATRVREFGAGMGHIPDRGTGAADGDGAWVVSGIDEAVGELHLRVGARDTDHRLRHGDGELALSECWSGQRVTVSAERVSTWRRLALEAGASRPTCDEGTAANRDLASLPAAEAGGPQRKEDR